MAIKLYTCGLTWLTLDAHHCQRVEKALREQHIPYEGVRLPLSRRKRDRIREISGQDRYPVIEFEDGSIYRDDSRRMAETIRAGRLDQERGLTRPPGAAAGR